MAGEKAAAIVLTVTVTVAGFDPFKTTGFGDAAQVDDAGAPLHVNAMEPLNPPRGAMASE